MNHRRWASLPVAWLLAGFALQANAEGERRQIEEVIVTAERVEATVSDTSISITAIGSEMLEDMGIQSANEFVNYIPATTRDDYDIRIRGVGRNFRALGGDPGVATYYNGVYSEDSLIALTENALLMLSASRFCVVHRARFTAVTPLVEPSTTSSKSQPKHPTV